jgi:hypothetical protein
MLRKSQYSSQISTRHKLDERTLKARPTPDSVPFREDSMILREGLGDKEGRVGDSKSFFFLSEFPPQSLSARNCGDAGDIVHGQHRWNWHSVSCCLVALALYTTCILPLNNSIPIFHGLTLQDNLRVLLSTLR